MNVRQTHLSVEKKYFKKQGKYKGKSQNLRTRTVLCAVTWCTDAKEGDCHQRSVCACSIETL